jgi:hypothetical protein
MVTRDVVTEKHYSLYLDDEILLKSVYCTTHRAHCFLISLVARLDVNHIKVSLNMKIHHSGLATLITRDVLMTGYYI